MRLHYIWVVSVGLALVGCGPAADNTGTGASRNSSDSLEGSGSSSGNLAATNELRAPDNTGINARDRSGSALTPMDQGTSATDRQLTSSIRRAITGDQFSADAKNIKVITVEGKVTLRGPVRDAQERQAVEAAVKALPGVSSVDNQLEAKQSNQ